MPRNPTYYHVAPRYTAGSPAQVDEATTQRVADAERRAFQHHLDGAYGDAERQRAEREGLAGVVYATLESGKNMTVLDLLTDGRYVVPLARWTGQHWHRRPDRDLFRIA